MDWCGIISNAGIVPYCWPVHLHSTLSYGHEFCLVTERTIMHIQTAKVSFLVAGLSLRDRVRILYVHWELRLDMLFCCI